MSILLARRLRISGLLVALGLIVEAITMLWSHPTRRSGATRAW